MSLVEGEGCWGMSKVFCFAFLLLNDELNGLWKSCIFFSSVPEVNEWKSDLILILNTFNSWPLVPLSRYQKFGNLENLIDIILITCMTIRGLFNLGQSNFHLE